jgi:hypothetical protein
MAKGRIARALIFLGAFLPSKGIYVNFSICPGSSLKSGNFNSKTLLLSLRKSIENCRTIIKMKTNFVRLLVKTSTFAKLMYAFS